MAKDQAETPIALERDFFLVLPDAPTWVSEPPKMSYEEMMRSCEKQLPYWNQRRIDAGKDYIDYFEPSPEPFVL